MVGAPFTEERRGEGVELEGLPEPQEKGSVTVQTCLSFLTV